jgi:hypothetical protein
MHTHNYVLILSGINLIKLIKKTLVYLTGTDRIPILGMKRVKVNFLILIQSSIT